MSPAGAEPAPDSASLRPMQPAWRLSVAGQSVKMPITPTWAASTSITLSAQASRVKPSNGMVTPGLFSLRVIFRPSNFKSSMLSLCASGVARMLVVVCTSLLTWRQNSSLSFVKVTSHSTMPAPVRVPASLDSFVCLENCIAAPRWPIEKSRRVQTARLVKACSSCFCGLSAMSLTRKNGRGPGCATAGAARAARGCKQVTQATAIANKVLRIGRLLGCVDVRSGLPRSGHERAEPELRHGPSPGCVLRTLPLDPCTMPADAR